MAANLNNYFNVTLEIGDPRLWAAINAQTLITVDSFLKMKNEDIWQICINIHYNQAAKSLILMLLSQVNRPWSITQALKLVMQRKDWKC
jgi:hypothetical protein